MWTANVINQQSCTTDFGYSRSFSVGVNRKGLKAYICLFLFFLKQWRNRRGGGGRGQSAPPPEISDREIFAALPGKTGKEKMEKGENWKEKKDNC